MPIATVTAEARPKKAANKQGSPPGRRKTVAFLEIRLNLSRESSAVDEVSD
jgi:hypothetical protein